MSNIGLEISTDNCTNWVNILGTLYKRDVVLIYNLDAELPILQ